MMWKLFSDMKNGYFEEYLELIKTTIENDRQKVNKRAEEIEKSGAKTIVTEDGVFEPYDEVTDAHWEIEEMEQLMYRTHIIGVFIFMEAQITSICETIYKKDNILFSYKDLNQTGVSRSIKYLKTVLKQDFPADISTREEFEIAKIVRNALVHTEGRIREENISKIENYISTHKDLISLKMKEVKVTYEYAKSIIELSKKICNELETHDSDW